MSWWWQNPSGLPDISSFLDTPDYTQDTFSLGLSSPSHADQYASLNIGSTPPSHNYGSLGHAYTPPPTHTAPPDLGPNPYQYSFDDASAKTEAQHRGAAALVGGLLDAYLNRGQGIGDAFKAQQKAYSDSYSSAEDDARQQALDKAKAQEWTMTRQDRLNTEQDRQEARNARIKLEQQTLQDKQTQAAHDAQVAAAAQAYRAAHPNAPESQLPDDQDLFAVIKNRAINEYTQANRPDHRYTLNGHLYNADTGKVEAYFPPEAKPTSNAIGPQDFLDAVDKETDRLAGTGPVRNKITGAVEAPDVYAARREAARAIATANVAAHFKAAGLNPQLPGTPVAAPTSVHASIAVPAAKAPAPAAHSAAPAPTVNALSQMVSAGRAAGHKDAEIRSFLLAKGHSPAEVDAAFSSAQ